MRAVFPSSSLSSLQLTPFPSEGYPEGHADSPDKANDIDFLFEKQQAGADFVVTQLFYDVDVFINWYHKCRERGELSLPVSPWLVWFSSLKGLKKQGITIPILPGIMPIQNYLSFRRMTNLCGTHIPSEIMTDLERIQVCPVSSLHRIETPFQGFDIDPSLLSPVAARRRGSERLRSAAVGQDDQGAVRARRDPRVPPVHAQPGEEYHARPRAARLGRFERETDKVELATTGQFLSRFSRGGRHLSAREPTR